jgi:hypothetical protein
LVPFLRGFVAAGLLSAIQDRLDPDEPRSDSRKVLRHAIQGGCAIGAATVAAQALARRDYGTALVATALGAAGAMAAEQALRPVSSQPLLESPHGEEE